MYTIYEPKDRIFICVIIALISSVIARTIIFSGSGGPHSWKVKGKSYQLNDIQNVLTYGMKFISLLCVGIILISLIQIAFRWVKKHNSI